MTGYSYDEYVTKYSDGFRRVRIDRDYLEKIYVFAEQLAEAKKSEEHHKKDNNQEIKRKITGLMGEAALEKLFGISIIDWTIGDSETYHTPDVPGFRVGIKTVEKGKFPIIFKENWYPQIICIRSDRFDDLIFVCGLATSETLNSCQSDDLVLDYKLRQRGTKTGFWGFSQLTPINSLEDLSRYRKRL